jgi:hypothetical protein
VPATLGADTLEQLAKRLEADAHREGRMIVGAVESVAGIPAAPTS